MYIEKPSQPGYVRYTDLKVRNGENTGMEIGLLWLQAGESHSFWEDELEVALLLVRGKVVLEHDGREDVLERGNPFDDAPWCLHMPRDQKAVLQALEESWLYVQKAENELDFASRLYGPDDIHTWHRGDQGELGGTIRRDVRTCFDYESRPESKMVLGEVVNLPGLWSSYPPHAHPQPEAYFYFFEKEQGFGAGWSGGKVYELRNHGCLLITDDTTHAQVMAPGYAAMYVWGIRHLDGQPWEKTRIDDPLHAWMLDEEAPYWGKPS